MFKQFASMKHRALSLSLWPSVFQSIENGVADNTFGTF